MKIEEKKLPKDWEVKRLGEVCKLKNGFAFKSDNYQENGVPVIRISDINSGIVSSKDAIRVEAKDDYENYLVETNDILVAMSGATTGKFGIFKSTEKAYQNQRVGKFKILDEKILNNQFLFYQINSLKKQIEIDAYGGAQPNISSAKIEQMQIVLPPLPEQQQIVAKIEELFSELENGKKELVIAQVKLKTYRQSLLKWAFEGRLTNKNLKANELPKGWEVKKLGEVCKKVEAIKRKEKNPEEEFFYLDIGGIDNETNKILNHKFYHWKDAPSRAQQIVFVGDVLFSTVRTYMKNIALVKNKRFHGQIASSGFCVIRANEKIVNSEYIFYYSLSQKFLQPLNELQTGSSYPAVRDKDVFLQLIPLPQIEEQKSIVAILESKLTICDAIEETIKTSIKQGEALRQSILKKAFEGQLIAPKIQKSLESNYKNKESKK